MFQPKDKVRHPGKPEWGVGEVLAAQPAAHEGKPCQRLTIRFDGAGRKTISTAFAKLQRLDSGSGPGPQPGDLPAPRASREAGRPQAPREQAPAGGSEISREAAAEMLSAVPETATDPFSPLPSRLKETLGLYRYEPQQRSLLDWATAQTGLRDPLSVFSRHDLEQAFETFRVKLDRHLRDLLGECRRSGVDPAPHVASAPSSARHALRRINLNR